MKIVLNERSNIQEIEVIINCTSNDETVQKIVSSLSAIDIKLTCHRGNEVFQLEPADILYIESVDRRTFLYTEQQIFETEQRLYELESHLENALFSSIKGNHYQFTTSTIVTSRVGGKTFAYNG